MKQEEDDEEGAGSVPGKAGVGSKSKQPLESPKEKRARLRLEKLSTGARFTSHRAEVTTSMSTAVGKLEQKMRESMEKLVHAKTCIIEALAKDKTDDVLLAYKQAVPAALVLGDAWFDRMVEHPDGLMIDAVVVAPEQVVPAIQATSASEAAPPAADPSQQEAPAKDEAPKPAPALQAILVKLPPATIPLPKLLAHFKDLLAPVQEPEKLKTYAELGEFVEKTRLIDDVLQVEVSLKLFKDEMKVIVEQFAKGLAQQAVDALNYITTKERRLVKASESDMKGMEKKEKDSAKAAAKAAARASKVLVKTSSPIWTIDVMTWTAVPVVGVTFEPDKSVDTPWMMKEHDCVKSWRADAIVSLRLSEFGGTYKKFPTFATEGRVQSPIVPKQGLEPTSEMFARLMPSGAVLDISTIQHGANFMQNAWYCGFSSDMDSAAFTANSGAMIRVMAMGGISVIVFSMTKVLAAMAGAGDTADLDAVSKFALNLSPMQEAAIKACDGYFCQLAAGDVIYVPQGWICCERATSGALLYGVRKSFMVATQEGAANYNASVSVLRRSKRDVTKMEAIAALMKT